MGDTANWEFAAVVAAVTIGLGGLLLFALTTIIGTWRVFRLASAAAEESAKAAVAVQDLARHLTAHERPAMSIDDLAALRRQADDLLEQQMRMQDAVNDLLETREAGGDDRARQIEELGESVRRLEANLSQVAAAVANLGQRAP